MVSPSARTAPATPAPTLGTLLTLLGNLFRDALKRHHFRNLVPIDISGAFVLMYEQQHEMRSQQLSELKNQLVFFEPPEATGDESSQTGPTEDEPSYNKAPPPPQRQQRGIGSLSPCETVPAAPSSTPAPPSRHSHCPPPGIPGCNAGAAAADGAPRLEPLASLRDLLFATKHARAAYGYAMQVYSLLVTAAQFKPRKFCRCTQCSYNESRYYESDSIIYALLQNMLDLSTVE